MVTYLWVYLWDEVDQARLDLHGGEYGILRAGLE